MGVEYRHYLIPANPAFVPSKGIFKRIDDFLTKWRLKADNPIVFDLVKGGNKRTDVSLDTLEMGQGIAVRFPAADGVSTEIMGPSYYDTVGDEDRYFQEITFVAGLDYRIHSNSEYFSFEVEQPPMEKGVLLEPYWEYDNLTYSHDQAYHGTMSTTPPVVTIQTGANTKYPKEFLGYWRTILIIDCGKDLPKLNNDLAYKIPNADFVREYENALGCDVVEIGYVY